MSPRRTLREQLVEAALRYPGAYEDFPWGEQVAKVRGRIFAFLGSPGGHRPGVTVKLPNSNEMARTFAAVTSAGYGLGRAGWVHVDLAARDRPDIGLLRDWLDESYRAVAPRRLVAMLDGSSAP